METSNCCSGTPQNETDYEIVRLPKTGNSCGVCEDYARRQTAKPVAVLCCEGACLRGEVARQAANLLCQTLAPEQTVRICLGGAFTKDSGQRQLVRNAARVVVLEGCHLNCASRMMRGVIVSLVPEIVVTDRLYRFDRTLFGSDEIGGEELAGHARSVAEQVLATL